MKQKMLTLLNKREVKEDNRCLYSLSPLPFTHFSCSMPLLFLPVDMDIVPPGLGPLCFLLCCLATHCVGYDLAVTSSRTESGATLSPFCLLIGQAFLFPVRISSQEYSI